MNKGHFSTRTLSLACSLYGNRYDYVHLYIVGRLVNTMFGKKYSSARNTSYSFVSQHAWNMSSNSNNSSRAMKEMAGNLNLWPQYRSNSPQRMWCLLMNVLIKALKHISFNWMLPQHISKLATNNYMYTVVTTLTFEFGSEERQTPPLCGPGSPGLRTWIRQRLRQPRDWNLRDGQSLVVEAPPPEVGDLVLDSPVACYVLWVCVYTNVCTQYAYKLTSKNR